MNIFKLIEEVWKDLMESSPNIVSDLKKSIVIAKHFNDNESIIWMEKEIDGYYSDNDDEKMEFPEYRLGITQHPLTPDIRTVTDWSNSLNIRYQTNKSRIINTPIAFPINRIIDGIKQFAINSKHPSFTFHTDDNKDLPFTIPIEFFERIMRGIEKRLSEYLTSLIMGQSKASLEFEDPLMRVLNYFPQVAMKYKERYAGRIGIEINDEYDVQDLLHMLLIPYYSTIKPEEYTTTMAGKSHRIDFLFLADRTGLEIKYITKENKTKISDQICADKEGYSKDNRIDKLYFFLYDPNYLISARNAYIHDLEQLQLPNISVKIIIKPD